MSAGEGPSCITIIGAGAIGCGLVPMLSTLANIRLHLIDGDTIEPANLPRQPLYGPSDVGRLKVEVAVERIAHLTASRSVGVHPVFIDAGNARVLLEGSAVVCDCTDDLPARLLIDRVCGELGIPLVCGAVHGQQVQVLSLHVDPLGAERPSSFRDFFPGRPAEEQEGCLMQQVPVYVTTLAAAVMAKHVNALLQKDYSRVGLLELIDVKDGRWLQLRAPSSPFDQELIACVKSNEPGR